MQNNCKKLQHLEKEVSIVHEQVRETMRKTATNILGILERMMMPQEYGDVHGSEQPSVDHAC
jgi:hypothetical protein